MSNECTQFLRAFELYPTRIEERFTRCPGNLIALDIPVIYLLKKKKTEKNRDDGLEFT
jgi:hypothetical protein